MPKRAPERVPLTPDTSQAGGRAGAPNGAAVPPPAATAPPGIFAIDVALFSSSTRASRLIDELTATGYRAYVKDLDLGDRGHLYEVVVGPFATRAEADTTVEQIHAMPGYGDARVVSSTP